MVCPMRCFLLIVYCLGKDKDKEKDKEKDKDMSYNLYDHSRYWIVF